MQLRSTTPSPLNARGPHSNTRSRIPNRSSSQKAAQPNCKNLLGAAVSLLAIQTVPQGVNAQHSASSNKVHFSIDPRQPLAEVFSDLIATVYENPEDQAMDQDIRFDLLSQNPEEEPIHLTIHFDYRPEHSPSGPLDYFDDWINNPTEENFLELLNVEINAPSIDFNTIKGRDRIRNITQPIDQVVRGFFSPFRYYLGSTDSFYFKNHQAQTNFLVALYKLKKDVEQGNMSKERLTQILGAKAKEKRSQQLLRLGQLISFTIIALNYGYAAWQFLREDGPIERDPNNPPPGTVPLDPESDSEDEG